MDVCIYCCGCVCVCVCIHVCFLFGYKVQFALCGDVLDLLISRPVMNPHNSHASGSKWLAHTHTHTHTHTHAHTHMHMHIQHTHNNIHTPHTPVPNVRWDLKGFGTDILDWCLNDVQLYGFTHHNRPHPW